MPRKQSTARKTGTVQKFIGTAYDEMKTLYDNLDYLLSLEDSLEELKWYLGATTTPPTEQADGSPLIDGNYYFNPVTNALGFYDVAQTMWVYISPEELEQLMLTTVANKEASDVSAANALASENAALVSQQAALLSEMNAGISAADALVSETNAASSEQTSDAHRIAAEASENASKASETASAQSASDALQSENNAETYKNQAEASKDAAAVSEANATADAIRAENAAIVSESALVPKGDWDASGGVFPVPTISPTERSDFYQIAVAGTMSDGVQDDVTVAVGDQLYWHVDRDIWYKIDNTDQVTSVNNRKGAVVVTKTDVGLSEVVNQGQSDSYTTTTATHASTKAVVDAHTKLDGEKLDKTANAVSATRLKDPFTITLDKDVTGSVSLDGENDVTVSVDVHDNGHSHDASTITGLANKADTVDQKGVLIPSTLSGDAPLGGTDAFIFFDEVEKEFVGFNPIFGELGSIGGSGIPAYSVISTGTTLTVEAGDGIRVDVVAIGADVTVNLPTIADGTRDGDFVSVGYKGMAAHDITLVSPDYPFMDTPLGTPLTLNGDYAVYTFSLSGGEWAIVNAVGEPGSTPVIRNKIEQVFPTGTDTFSLAYDVGYVDVFLDGTKLDDTSILAEDGETVQLVDADGNPMPLLKDTHVLVQAWNHVEVTDISADMVTYNNTDSGLGATNVKDAIDEVWQGKPNDNLLINGDFSVWQRGQAGTGTGYVSVDRWYASVSTSTIQISKVGTNHAAHITTSAAWAGIAQVIEDVGYLAGQTVTLSFDWQVLATGNLANAYVEFNFSANDGTERATTFYPIDLSTDGKKVVTLTLPSDGELWDNLRMVIRLNKGTSSTEGGRIYNAKLEEGSVATPFISDSPQVNLAKCQRYYQTVSGALTYNSYATAAGQTSGSSYLLACPMRIVPTFVNLATNFTSVGFTGFGVSPISDHGFTIGGVSVGTGRVFYYLNSGVIAFDAEL